MTAAERIYLFIEGSTYPYDAVCLETTDCCRIPREEIEALMGDPAVAVEVIRLEEISASIHLRPAKVTHPLLTQVILFACSAICGIIYIRHNNVSVMCLCR